MDREEIIKLAKEAGAYLLMRLDGEDVYQISGNASIERFAALVESAATEKANERANESWASMCEKMVAAEREAMVSEAAKLGWAMKNEDPFEDSVAEVARIRAQGEC